jgi:acetyl-CoA carboxylase beta subunit
MTQPQTRPQTTPRRDARALRDYVLDPGSWKSWDAPILPRDRDPDYEQELAEAREKTRLDEAILTGEGTLRGRRVAVVAGGAFGAAGRGTVRVSLCVDEDRLAAGLDGLVTELEAVAA